jgi:allophanate hydrolase
MNRVNVRSIAHDVNTGLRSAADIARDTLERIADYDAIQPEAWISRLPTEQILERARLIDQGIAAGQSLPLAGVPVAVKDNIDVAEMQTTAACPEFAYQAAASAHVVERLLAAGAIVMGKTNLDQFATGLVGTRSPYGSPGCVFNREYVSGGSSSGSAVLVAAGVIPLALGTDTAGSGRVPAAFNNLVGFKPTRGRWSSRGVVPACRSLDCVAAFTVDVDDAVLVDSIVADHDRLDPYARRPPVPAREPRIAARFNFGIPRAGQLKELAPEEGALFSTALRRLREAGGTPVEVDVAPLLAAANLLYSGPWIAERTAVLESLLQRRPTAIHPVVRAIVAAGKAVSAVDAFRGQYALQEYARFAEELWDRIEVLVLPTTPTIYRIREVMAEPVALNAHLGLYTNFVNLLDMSAISLPAGFRANGTGAGVSLIGPAWADESLLALAGRYAAAGDVPQAPRLDKTPRPSAVRLAVVGAHLSGMPLNWQLTARNARLVRAAKTAPVYRLYAMAEQSPPKPALAHVGNGGGSIELEIYELDVGGFGSFVAEVPAPLAIGTVVLEDGSLVRGFVAEPRALTGATDITTYGGWRAYLASRAT